jgi:hypothetical protein
VGSLQRAAAFVEDVGFALLFPKRGIELPSLWGVVVDRSAADEGIEWGPDAERMWGWKDELPRRRLAWYGRFLRGRPSFLSPSLLRDLYPREGRPDDFEGAQLDRAAARIARVLLRSGPLASAVLREAVGMEGVAGAARFSRALSQLGRALVVTNFGTEDQGSGWPSAVLELTARAFPGVADVGDRDEASVRAARRFLETQLAARPYELGNAFGWRAAEARGVLEELVARNHAARHGPGFVLTTTRGAGPIRGRRSSSPP